MTTAYRQAHPLPYVLAHWVHVLGMAVLAFTGFFIHDPFFAAPMGMMRQVHFFAMYVVLVGFMARAWYLVAGATANRRGTREVRLDIRNFVPQAENRGQLLETAKYYVFLRRTHPTTGKYNPLQKIAYVTMGVLIVVQALTGFALYEPALSTPLLGDVLTRLAAVAGGLMAVRVTHYLVMWALLALTAMHIYLALAEDIVQVPLMFLWREHAEPADKADHAEVA